MRTDTRRRQPRRRARRRRGRAGAPEIEDALAFYTKGLPYPHTCRSCNAYLAIDEETKRCSACGWDEATWLARCT